MVLQWYFDFVRYGTGANEATDEGTAKLVLKGWLLLLQTTLTSS